MQPASDPKKIRLTWNAVMEAVHLLRSVPSPAPRVIIGVSRGGVIPARLLQELHRDAHLVTLYPGEIASMQYSADQRSLVIIDEVYDTGSTFNKIHELFPAAQYISLWCKHPTPPSWLHYAFWSDPDAGWLVFPWEGSDLA